MRTDTAFATSIALLLVAMCGLILPAASQNVKRGTKSQPVSTGLTDSSARKAAGKVWQAPARWEDEIEERITQAQINYGPSDDRVLRLMWQAVQLYQRAGLFDKELDTLRDLRKETSKRTIPSLPPENYLEKLEGRLVNALTPKDGNRYIDGEYFIIHCSNIKLDYLSPITLDKHDGTPSRPIARATVSFTKLGKSKTFPILPSHVGMLQALPAVQTQSSPEGFLLEIVADQPRGPLYCRSIREFQPAFEFMEYRRAKPSAYLTKVAVMDLKTWLNQACKNAADLSARVDRKAETDWRRLLSYNFKPGRVEYTQNGHRVSRVVPARVWWDTASNVIYSVPDGAEI